MELHQVLDDRQAEPEPASLTACVDAIGLAEALEDVRQELRRDADAGVGDRDLDVRVHALEQHVHPAARAA